MEIELRVVTAITHAAPKTLIMNGTNRGGWTGIVAVVDFQIDRRAFAFPRSGASNTIVAGRYSRPVIGRAAESHSTTTCRIRRSRRHSTAENTDGLEFVIDVDAGNFLHSH